MDINSHRGYKLPACWIATMKKLGVESAQATLVPASNLCAGWDALVINIQKQIISA